jgi:hypothetical protein
MSISDIKNIDKPSVLYGMILGIILMILYYYINDDGYVSKKSIKCKTNNKTNNNQIDVLSIKDDKLHKKIDIFVNTIVITAKKNIALLCKDKSLIIDELRNVMYNAKKKQKKSPKKFNKLCNYERSKFSILKPIKKERKNRMMNNNYSSEENNRSEPNEPQYMQEMEEMEEMGESRTEFAWEKQFKDGIPEEYNQLDDAYTDLMYYIVKTFFCKDGIILLDKLEDYLIKIINSVCSKSDNPIDKLENGIQWGIKKPLSYL